MSLETADKIMLFLSETASEKRGVDAQPALREAYRRNPAVAQAITPASENEESFVQQHIENTELLNVPGVSTAIQFTFLSSTTNLLFDTPQFSAEDLPKDLIRVYSRVDGAKKFIEVKFKLRLKLFNDVDEWNQTQVVIQGADAAWVNAKAKWIEELLDFERLPLRGMVYGNARLCFWLMLIMVLGAEYSLFRLSHPYFRLDAPLSGLAAISLFAILVGTLLGVGNIMIASWTYLFPYCELEGNLSRRRTGAQKVAKAVLLGVLTTGTMNVLYIVFSPFWKK